MEVFSSLAVCSFSILIPVLFSGLIRRMPPNLSTDNAIHVQFAAQLRLWDWPSKMHRHVREKFRMKDVGVLCLALMQRLLGDRTSMYPMVVLGGAAASISAVLIYFITQNYWNTNVGLLASALFLFCFWPYQISLMGGFHCLAQVCLLVSILLLQTAEGATFPYQYICYALAGVASGMIVFASASGRKFIPLFIGAFLYSQRHVMDPLGLAAGGWKSLSEGFGFFLLCLFSIISAGVITGLLFVHFLYKPLVTIAYQKSGPSWLNRMIKSADKYPLERYLKYRNRCFSFVARFGFKIVFCFLLSLVLSRSPSFSLAQVLVLSGMVILVFCLTYPNVVENLRGYIQYHYTTYDFSRFDLYADYFKKIGWPIPKSKRGSGLSWVIRFLPSVVPFHVAYFLVALGLLLFVLFLNGFEYVQILKTAAVMGLSLSPIIYGEWTKAPQSSRSYFPALMGIVLFIAYGCFQFERVLSSGNKSIFWFLVICAALSAAAWNIWVFFNDIFPARMLSANLVKTLQRLGIREFYTYDTRYNDVFVNAIPPEIKKDYQINYIQSLAEAKQGYVAIPGISSKSWSFESYECGIKGWDFDKDPLLTKLIRSKEIEHFSVASFKTIGTSKIWVNESEITTYRNYIIKDITELDRWCSRAWIVDAGKLQNHLKKSAWQSQKSV